MFDPQGLQVVEIALAEPTPIGEIIIGVGSMFGALVFADHVVQHQERMFQAQDYNPLKADWEENGAPPMGTGAGRNEQTGTGDTQAQNSSDQSTNAQQQQEQQTQGVVMSNAQSGEQTKPESAASEITFDDVFGNATPGRKTKGKTEQRELPGTLDDANGLFDGVVDPESVKGIDGGRTGTLPDGRPINVRDGETGTSGKPTVEVQEGKNKKKIRFVEPETKVEEPKAE